MYIITFIVIFNYEKDSSYRNSIFSDSDVQAKNYSQAKLINSFLREIISFNTKQMTLETGANLYLSVCRNWSLA